MLLSIVIPAWNEEGRLLPVLEGIRSYGVSQPDVRDYEVIVVDDGSRDRTAALVNERAALWDELRLISLPENRGKGAALRTGCVNARGEFVLFYDADGATSIEQETVLRSELTEQTNLHLAMGVRYRADSDVTMGAFDGGWDGCLRRVRLWSSAFDALILNAVLRCFEGNPFYRLLGSAGRTDIRLTSNYFLPFIGTGWRCANAVSRGQQCLAARFHCSGMVRTCYGDLPSFVCAI